MPSVKNGAGIPLEYSSSVNDEYGAEPLLCHVSKTYSSLFVFVLLHCLHFIVMLSIHGRCNSKFGPSGNFAAESMISFLVKSQFCFLQSLHIQTGNGHPQILSRDIQHNGYLCLIFPIFTSALRSLRSSTIILSASLTNIPSYFPAKLVNFT